jgi:hypothetical protein
MSARAFIIHNLEHTLCVAKASQDLKLKALLFSAPGLATTLGPEAFAAIIDEAERSYPGSRIAGVLDCADEPGTAIGALRRGTAGIFVNLPQEMLGKIEDIARQTGAKLIPKSETALDLLNVRDMDKAIRQHLSNGPET